MCNASDIKRTGRRPRRDSDGHPWLAMVRLTLAALIRRARAA